jgi:hypothetical protein
MRLHFGLGAAQNVEEIDIRAKILEIPGNS